MKFKPFPRLYMLVAALHEFLGGFLLGYDLFTSAPEGAPVPSPDQCPFDGFGLSHDSAGLPFNGTGAPFDGPGLRFNGPGVPFGGPGVPFGGPGVPFGGPGVPLNGANGPLAEPGIQRRPLDAIDPDLCGLDLELEPLLPFVVDGALVVVSDSPDQMDLMNHAKGELIPPTEKGWERFLEAARDSRTAYHKVHTVANGYFGRPLGHYLEFHRMNRPMNRPATSQAQEGVAG